MAGIELQTSHETAHGREIDVQQALKQKHTFRNSNSLCRQTKHPGLIPKKNLPILSLAHKANMESAMVLNINRVSC